MGPHMLDRQFYGAFSLTHEDTSAEIRREWGSHAFCSLRVYTFPQWYFTQCVPNGQCVSAPLHNLITFMLSIDAGIVTFAEA